MKLIRLIIGLALLGVGLLWVGQGLGYVQWPANNFMISEIKWAYYGGVMAVIGFLIVLTSFRK